MTLMTFSTLALFVYGHIREASNNGLQDKVTGSVSSGGQITIETDSESYSQKTPRIPRTLLITLIKSESVDAMGEPHSGNVNHNIVTNEDLRTFYFDKDACFSLLMRQGHPRLSGLVKSYRKGDDDSFASGICRAAYLYEWGGFYLDNDVEVLLPLTELVDAHISFMSVWSSRKGSGPHPTFTSKEITNNFMGVEPKSPIFANVLHEYWKMAANGQSLLQKEAGPEILQTAFENFMKSCNDETNVKFSEASICGKQVRMFFELKMDDSNQTDAAHVEPALLNTVSDEIASRTGNMKEYALLDLAKKQRLVGWPRCFACNAVSGN